MKCAWCGLYSSRKYCSAYCRWLDDEVPYVRYWPLETIRGEREPYPAYTREMRTMLLAARAMTHRVEPCRTYY